MPTPRTHRRARVARRTRETRITAALSLDGRPAVSVRTGLPFLDHMLTLFGTHGAFGLSLRAVGDLEEIARDLWR